MHVCRIPPPCESLLQGFGAAVCGLTGRRGMCGSCANFCTALQCAAGRAGVTRHNLQIPRGRGLAKLARVPRPGAAAGVPSPAQRGVQLQSAGRAAQQTFARFSGRAQLCNSRHTPPGAAHTDAVALVPGYWDIAAILWLEWSSLWCNRRAPPISRARC